MENIFAGIRIFVCAELAANNSLGSSTLLVRVCFEESGRIPHLFTIIRDKISNYLSILEMIPLDIGQTIEPVLIFLTTNFEETRAISNHCTGQPFRYLSYY